MTLKAKQEWFVGCMNDAQFIITKKPCPPTDFVHPGHDDPPDVIAKVCDQQDKNETDRNARLLAASPKMYAAIKDALKESGCDGDLCSRYWHEVFRKIVQEIDGEV